MTSRLEDAEMQQEIDALTQQVAALRADLARVTAERDEGLLNCKRIDEAEFLKRVESGQSGGHLTPLGNMLMGVRAERDLALAAAKDSADARDAVAAENVEMRAACERLAEAVINDENLHETNDDGDVMQCDSGCSCELPTLINATLATPSSSAAQVERMKAEAFAARDEAWRMMLTVGNSESDPVISAFAARVREDERAKCLPPAAATCATAKLCPICREVGGGGKIPNPDFTQGGPIGLPCPRCGTGREGGR